MNRNRKNRHSSIDVLRNKIPYIRCFEEEGIIETKPNEYTKCYFIHDIKPESVKVQITDERNPCFASAVRGAQLIGVTAVKAAC